MKFLERLFFQRPRILNQLHRLGLAGPTSQTGEQELAALSRYARGAKKAVEIGTYQGVSAVRIAESLTPDGILFCVDPWPGVNGKPDPCWLICERHLRRSKMRDRIKILRAFSAEIENQLPSNLDFAFIDGDHSWNGIETDWRIVSPRLACGAVICLHDSVTPAAAPWLQLDSIRFYHDVIAADERFEPLEIVQSMAVLRKR
jgi:predicted O-methyltransferase YrrM